ncbi:MAG: AAA family ATPase [Candidatus Muiribacteriota bacterium]
MIDLNDAPVQRPEKKEVEHYLDAVSEFQGILTQHGLFPDEIITDNKIHRFDVDKKGDMAGWYTIYEPEPNVLFCYFGNWKEVGISHEWSSISKLQLTSEQLKEFKDKKKQADKERKELKEKLAIEKKSLAQYIWKKSKEKIIHEDDHPYLKEKKVSSYHLRLSRKGDIIIPLMDEHGEIWSLQFIKPENPPPESKDKRKKYLKDAKKEGCFFEITGNKDIYICEGYSTGKSIHDATGGTVICAMDAPNLKLVSKKIKEKYPSKKITICADNDQFKPPNTGILVGKESAKAIDAHFTFPVFKDNSTKPTDFNDLANQEGLAAVQLQISQGGGRQSLPPLASEATSVKNRVFEKPPPMEFIFYFDGVGLLPKGIVGTVTATGGTGKTVFLMQLADAAAGVGSVGPLHVLRPIKTLCLFGEDSQEEIDRRQWNICKGQFPDQLHTASVYGEVGPLMKLDGNTPVRGDGFYWLEETIKLHKGLELLVLDPKSRFYGLDENSADHATQWIQCLEYLAKEYNLTILFTHHSNKNLAGSVSQNMSRGSSALVDGCRFQAGLAQMSYEQAEKMGVNPRDYIFFDVPKSNYSAGAPRNTFFKRGENGIFEFEDLENKHVEAMAEELWNILNNTSASFSLRELEKDSSANEIRKDLKQIFPEFKRTDIAPVVRKLISLDMLEEVEVQVGGNKIKKQLKIKK